MTTRLVRSFLDPLPFTPDAFQRAAIGALPDGRSVLVAAPTGAGKTLVGEFACHVALAEGTRAFYTTPIKALSNQKHRDLADLHGDDRVGLLTGDRSINGSAPIVVMTTEVLRNMLFTGSDAVDDLAWVILDEVHYLGDWERGGVWEEVIVQLPDEVRVAALSATVSNAEEFGEWLAQARGGCETIITEDRPVPLRHHYWVNGEVHDTFRSGHDGGSAGRARARQAQGGRPNPDVLMLERQANQSLQARGRGGRGKRVPRVRMRWPGREEVVTELARRDWLPAILFVFSRNGCDKAVAELLRAGIPLTSRVEADEIAAVVDTMLADIPAADLEVLGHAAFRSALQAGIAPHHAGLIPAFKEAVEVCFQRGLLKVVVATETLALGINMPARTVVIERLEKWDGARHALLTPGQYTQLTGRAGRRGIDRLGHAIVLHQRDVEFRRVAGLVGARSHPLSSTFRPSHNLVVNLLATHTVAESEAMLEASFAQFQADREVATDRELLAGLERQLQDRRAPLSCHLGDWQAYADLARTARAAREEEASRSARRQRRDIEDAIAQARPGEVWVLPWMGRRGLAAVVSSRVNRNGVPLVEVVDDDRRLTRLGPRDLDVPPRRWRTIDVPSGNPRNSNVRALVARALRGLPEPPADEERALGQTRAIGGLEEQLAAHPCHDCPQRPEHERQQRAVDTVLDQIVTTRARIDSQAGSLVRQFEQRVAVLRELGHLDDTPRPTAEGRVLAGIHSEVDLALAETLLRGGLDGLDPAELAGAVSAFVFEARSDEEPDVWIPTPDLADALDRIEVALRRVQESHARHGVTPLRELDATFVPAAWRWGRGSTLDEALVDQELTPGDFVRVVKQVIDVLSQLRAVDDGSVGEAAHAAIGRLRRGIVDL